MTEEEFSAQFMAHLNEDQKKAVASVEGAVLLLAVPGSGKTTVLITRLGYMVCCKGIDPRRILTMTYTTAATREMAQRFSSLFGSQYELPFCTINSLSNQIIRVYADYRKKEVPFTLIENQQAVEMVADIYLKTNREFPTDSTIKDIRTGITYIKNKMLTTDEEIGEADIGVPKMVEIYREYCRRMEEGALMDFDDQMAYAYRILKGSPAILDWFQECYPYICVDESQDTSRIQHEIISLLAKKHGNLFMVGDEDQSIYGFRAAYPEALLDFKKDYPKAKILLMEENYRSTKQIVAAANAFVSRNRFRYKKEIHAMREDGPAIGQIQVVDRVAQFQYLFALAKDCREDTAILYRNNDSSLPLIDMLERNQIPYNRRNSEDAFFTHRIVTDVTDIIRFAENQQDGERFLRFCHKLFIPKAAGQWAVDRSLSSGKPVQEELLRCPDLSGYGREIAMALCHGLADMLAGSAENAVSWIFHGLRYSRYVELNNLDAGKYDILMLLARNEPDPLSFLQRLEDLNAIIRNHRNRADTKLTLSTVHSSKGLEYDTVYLLDIFDGVLPARKPRDVKTQEDIRHYEEDRRIYYVAMTRAKNQLCLFTFPDREASFTAETLSSLPRAIPRESDIFADFHRNLCGRTFLHREKGKGRILGHWGDRLLVEYAPFEGEILTLSQLAALWDPTPDYGAPSREVPELPKAQAECLAANFKVGGHVNHAAYGDGIVQALENGIVTVAFGSDRTCRSFVLEICLRKGLLR